MAPRWCWPSCRKAPRWIPVKSHSRAPSGCNVHRPSFWSLEPSKYSSPTSLTHSASVSTTRLVCFEVVSTVCFSRPTCILIQLVIGSLRRDSRLTYSSRGISRRGRRLQDFHGRLAEVHVE